MRNYLAPLVFSIIGGTIFFAACEKIIPSAPDDNELLDGPVEGLTGEQNSRFLKGDRAFNGEVFNVQTGLGPLFVATSCGSCHAGDGKGTLFTTLTRFGQTNHTGNQFLHLGGPQLQHRAIAGFEPEKVPEGASSSKFTPPANTGLGFFDFVPDIDILAMADINDIDGDGISGAPNWINIPEYVQIRQGTVTENGKYIGRFGKKAGVYDLLQQTAAAYNQDMGIVSVYEPVDTYTGNEIDPEVSSQTVLDVVFYLQTLKAPLPRDENNTDVVTGKSIFSQIKCAACHRQELKTSDSPIAPLSNKTFYPYTDLLLHDMGDGLNDGYTEGSAHPAEWRTPPLWGLGLSQNSQGGKLYLMHDGRAQSIEAAILLHGGEAENSKNLFQALSVTEKAQLIQFLESL